MLKQKTEKDVWIGGPYHKRFHKAIHFAHCVILIFR